MSDLLKRLENLPLDKRELVLQKLRQKQKKSVIEKGKQNPSIKPVSREQPISLSFAQTRLWFLDRLEEQSSHYNVPLYLELKGDLNPDALTKAITEIIQRHEVLRTNFRIIDDQPVQIITQNAHINLPIIDLDYQPFSEQIKKVKQLAKEELQESFNLEHDSLLRGKIIRLNHQYHILLLVMHHIVGDAWSMGIFTRELSTLYESYCTGTLPSLPKLAIQYADFAHWQRQWLQGTNLDQQLNYWQDKLAGIPPVLEIPTDKTRPAVQHFRGSSESFEIDRDLTEKLKTLSQSSGTTLFMTLLAAFSVLLSRYSNQEDLAIGSPIANRNHHELEALIGFFVNTIVFRINLEKKPTFKELLSRVRQTALEAYSHQDLPFEKLVEELQLDRSLSHNPLFQVMFTLNNAPMEELTLKGLTIRPWPWEDVTTQFDLTLLMKETQQGLKGEWDYNSDLFEPETIQRMARHFSVLLNGIVENPEQGIHSFSLMSPEEIQQLKTWNSTDCDYPPQTLADLFEQQVLKTPNGIAVSFGSDRLSYQQLNQKANQLAHYLRQNQAIGPNTLVGICLERSLDMIIGVLGVIKAGGAYVPIDPNYPQERIRLIIEDAATPVLLTQTTLTKHLPLTELKHSCQVLCLDTLSFTEAWIEPGSAHCGMENPTLARTPHDLAYVIYTSGSTGKPKGVAMPQGALINLINWQRSVPGLDQPAKTLQFTTLSFDVSFQEIFSTFSTGGELVLIGDETRRDVSALLDYLSVHQIDRLYLPFVALQHLADYGTQGLPLSLKHVITAGEQLRITPSIRAFFKALPDCRLHNHYGPSESHVVTALSLPKSVEAWEDLPSIGQPIANNRIYILDCHNQPVAVGIPGELCIAGVGLAQGYLNRPDLTKERFITIDLWDKTEQVYKTGDLARWRPDGNLEYLGRIDHQVKLRGFRIELGEIESVLGQHPQVQEGVVVVREDSPGNPQLVAYVTHPQGTTVTPSKIRQFLKEKLPDYMVPSVFVTLDSLPVSANGKLDRRALPVPSLSLEDNGGKIPPRTALELELVQLWESLFNVAPIGLQDNFFDLGGHSLLSVSLISRIQQQFGQKLPVSVLFEEGTVEHLAALLSKEGNSSQWSRSTVVPLQPKGVQPPFFCVHPGAGTVVWYRELARYLAPEFPFYALESLGLDGDQKPYDRVEDMAAHYIQGMQTVQPQGPYQIGGWCFGAVVAFEMAQQLQSQGHEVSKLILIDMNIADPIDREEAHTMDDDVIFLVRLFKRHLPDLPETLKTLDNLSQEEELCHLIEQVKTAQKIPPDFGVAQVKRLLEVFRGHLKGLMSYTPKPYNGTGILFQATEGEAANAQDASLGWADLVTGGTELHWVPGNHTTMFQEPNVEVLAQTLRTTLLN
ncbi:MULTISPECIES: amino acid adenylation domain-containing protein [Moorena]|uniref:Amino acid adenylation domain protein n=1 Tax=Moorena producens 3L TaxID=489825 RepID=F4Y2N0_9CYAN|nr:MULTISPECIES: amino acid adenylation domain-containing protein [Moorena]AEE88238.1 putative nonribosomal peptide synthetase [Moorena producens 3L]EGJ28874.1 amino acid adenylation domain protein [Moorena producens 3L]NEP65601.1 amino acid adenylation domain-containing protein [Moorena sp. SIO3A5]NER86062.1 amino acid adenylation domain-containing protein [Moorena sp. SIO3A2]OLT66626.1 hypothetical protein BI334_17870 [Moorena producens 3L]